MIAKWMLDESGTDYANLAEALATFCCGVFFGAAAYISLVQHPAAVETGVEFAARFFPPMYGRAAVMQASLAVIGTAAALAASLLGAGRAWLLTAILLGSVIPFTLLIINPVNQQLKTMDPSADQAADLLIRWGRLHWVRTVTSGLSFITCLIGVVRRPSKMRASDPRALGGERESAGRR